MEVLGRRIYLQHAVGALPHLPQGHVLQKCVQDVEARIQHAVQICDELGFPLTRERVKSLAQEMSNDKEWIPSDGWYDGFVSRLGGEYKRVLQRRQTLATMRRHISDNITWWYERVTRPLLQHRFASNEGGLDGELSMFISDETAINSYMSKKVNPQEKARSKINSSI